MVLVLKRYVNVLPWRPTLVFAGKLAVMSVAVGVVGWVTLRWTEARFPYELYRLERSRMYDVIKLVHCTLPSIAAGLVMILALVLLKFDETGFVIQWVKDRGWKRRGQVRKVEETSGDE